MNYSDLITLILTQLRTHVNSDQFLEQFRRSKAFVRHRKLTLKQVVAYLIYSKKRSMDIELSALQRQIPDIEFPDVSRQAVSEARRGILPDLFKELLMNRLKLYTNMPLVQKAGLDTVFSLLMDLRWRSHYPTTHPLNLERLQAVITRIFAGWRVFFPLSMMSFLIR